MENAIFTVSISERALRNGQFFMQESLDNITLFSIITIMSFFLMAPVAFFMEGIKFTPTYLQATVSKSR